MIRIFHKDKRKLEVAPTAQSWNNLNAKIEYECKPLEKKIEIHKTVLIINR